MHILCHKWVAVQPLLFSTENVVVTFIFEDIFTHFGVPREIVFLSRYSIHTQDGAKNNREIQNKTS